jgi:hypothetical protein
MRISLILIQREHAGLPVQSIGHVQKGNKNVPGTQSALTPIDGYQAVKLTCQTER